MHLTCTLSVDWVCCADLKLSSQGSFAVVWFGWSGLTVAVWWSDFVVGQPNDGLAWNLHVVVWPGVDGRWSCVMVLLGVGSDGEDWWSNLSTGLPVDDGLVCWSGDGLIWKIKRRNAEVRKQITQLCASGKLRKEKRRNWGNTFFSAVATLKRTATTKPNYISNYQILLRIIFNLVNLAKCSIVNCSARHHGNLLF